MGREPEKIKEHKGDEEESERKESGNIPSPSRKTKLNLIKRWEQKPQ